MTVDLIPNPEKYEDIYPEPESEEEKLDEEEEVHVIEDPLEAKNLQKELSEIDDELTKAHEDFNSAAKQRKILDDFASSVRENRPADLKGFVSAYREERSKVSTSEVGFFSDCPVPSLLIGSIVRC